MSGRIRWFKVWVIEPAPNWVPFDFLVRATDEESAEDAGFTAYQEYRASGARLEREQVRISVTTDLW